MKRFLLLSMMWAVMPIGGSEANAPQPAACEIPVVAEGYVGMQVQPISTEDRMRYGAAMPVYYGVKVAHVAPGSPAALAGVQVGDVPGVVHHYPISQPEDVVRALARFSPGDKIDLTVYRNGRHEHLTLTMARRPEPAVVAHVVAGPTVVQDAEAAAEHQRRIARLLAAAATDIAAVQAEFRALHGYLRPKQEPGELRIAFRTKAATVSILRREQEIVVLVEPAEQQVQRYSISAQQPTLPPAVRDLLHRLSR